MTKRRQKYRDVVDAAKLGMSRNEIAEVTGMTLVAIDGHLNSALRDADLVRTGRGKYAAPPEASASDTLTTYEQAPVVRNGSVVNSVIESLRRKVDIPLFLRKRVPVTITVIRDEDDIEGVLKLELKIGETWFPVHFTGDLRMLLGRRRPEWSGTQVTYEGVCAYRVTLVDGDQFEVGHDPQFPITIDSIVRDN